MKKLLKGHFSEETAYVVEDYPYGFTLRCKKRFWIEQGKSKKQLAFRLVSQTTNPKKSYEGYEHWNKPKKSTYCLYGAVLYLGEKDHVWWHGLSQYSDAEESQKFLDENEEVLTLEMIREIKAWISAKEKFDADLKSGKAVFTINGKKV